MLQSLSVSGGAHNARHNTDPAYRATLSNVDPAMTEHNVVLLDESIEDTYQQLFGEAVAAHDETQRAKRHPERCYGGTGAYLRKVTEAYQAAQERARSGKPKSANVPAPCVEYVLQVGNRDTWRELGVSEHIAILQEAAEAVREATGSAIKWFQIAIHVDEVGGTPHMHLAGVPYATGCKRGLETQVSLSGALRELGLKRKPDLQELLMRELERVAEAHGVTRDVRGESRAHMDVPTFKQVMGEVERETDRLERLRCVSRDRTPEVGRALAAQREAAAGERADEAENRQLEQQLTELERRESAAREVNQRLRERNSELGAERDGLAGRVGELESRVGWLARHVDRVREGLAKVRDRFFAARDAIWDGLASIRDHRREIRAVDAPELADIAREMGFSDVVNDEAPITEAEWRVMQRERGYDYEPSWDGPSL